MNETILKKLAKPMIVLATLIWGSTFFIMKDTLDSVDLMFLLAFRFTFAAAVLSLVFWKRWKTVRPADWLRGTVMGLLLFAAYTVQNYGLMGTTPGKNAFFTAVYCVIVPFLYWAVMGRKPDRYNILSALLCVAGVALVSVTGEFTVGLGDSLTLVGAFFYAAHIIAVEKVSEGEKDIYLLTVIQFASAAVFCWVGNAMFGSLPPAEAFTPSILLQLSYLIVMCTTVALLFQNVGQIWSDPASASILLSLESVFGVLFSVLFYHDPVTARLLLGFGLIFVAVVCSETKFSFLKKRQA